MDTLHRSLSLIRIIEQGRSTLLNLHRCSALSSYSLGFIDHFEMVMYLRRGVKSDTRIQRRPQPESNVKSVVLWLELVFNLEISEEALLAYVAIESVEEDISPVDRVSDKHYQH